MDFLKSSGTIAGIGCKNHIKPFTRCGKAFKLNRSMPLTRAEAIAILKPFLDYVSSVDESKPFYASIPILRELTGMAANAERGAPAGTGPLKKRINRLYCRLCRLQEELGRLDLKKAKPNVSLGLSAEDYIFSSIDFSRYREINENYFTKLFAEGLADFGEDFLMKNFKRGKGEIKTLIETSYKKVEGVYKIGKDSPLILSVMRTLETSLDTLPLFSLEEITEELNRIPANYGGRENQQKLYSLLVTSLDGVLVTHDDGMTAKLFINDSGELAGTFRPADKPWTVALVKPPVTS